MEQLPWAMLWALLIEKCLLLWGLLAFPCLINDSEMCFTQRSIWTSLMNRMYFTSAIIKSLISVHRSDSFSFCHSSLVMSAWKSQCSLFWQARYPDLIELWYKKAKLWKPAAFLLLTAADRHPYGSKFLLLKCTTDKWAFSSGSSESKNKY